MAVAEYKCALGLWTNVECRMDLETHVGGKDSPLHPQPGHTVAE